MKTDFSKAATGFAIRCSRRADRQERSKLGMFLRRVNYRCESQIWSELDARPIRHIVFENQNLAVRPKKERRTPLIGHGKSSGRLHHFVQFRMKVIGRGEPPVDERFDDFP